MKYGVIIEGWTEGDCLCGDMIRTETLVSVHDTLLHAHDAAWKLHSEGASAIVEECDGSWKVGETRKDPQGR